MALAKEVDKSKVPGGILNPFVAAEATDLTSTDWTPSVMQPHGRCCTGLLVTASGNVVIELVQGGTMTIPVAVTSNHHFAITGYLIAKLIKSGTTANVPYALY